MFFSSSSSILIQVSQAASKSWLSLFKKQASALAVVAPLLEASSCGPKGRGFDSW